MAEPIDTLSEREQEILRLVATGAANKEIAHQLTISPNTVKVHVRNIFAKIGVSSRTEATLYAIKIGLVQTPEGGASESTVAASPAETVPEAALTPVEELPTANFQQGLPGIVLEDGYDDRSARRPRAVWPVLAISAALVVIALAIFGANLFPRTADPTAVPPSAPTLPPPARWAARESLPSPRRGMGAAEYGGALYVIGGETGGGIDASLLRFDTEKNTWESLSSKPTAVTDVQAALIGEKIYVPGGRAAGGKTLSLLEVYDPRENRWETRAPLPAPRSAYALATFEGKLYLFGGKNGSEYAETVYEYNPETDRWLERWPLSQARAFSGAAVVDGKIYLLGGYDGKAVLNLNEAYFPARDTAPEGGEAAGQPSPWETYAPMPDARYAMGVEELAGMIFVLGGKGEGTGVPAALQYQPQADTWAGFEPPPQSVQTQPAFVAYGNYLYAIGGFSENGLSAATLSYQGIYTISLPLLTND